MRLVKISSQNFQGDNQVRACITGIYEIETNSDTVYRVMFAPRYFFRPFSLANDRPPPPHLEYAQTLLTCLIDLERLFKTLEVCLPTTRAKLAKIKRTRANSYLYTIVCPRSVAKIKRTRANIF